MFSLKRISGPGVILDFRFRILDSQTRSLKLRPPIQNPKSKIQNIFGGTERTRTVIVFVDSEVHTPFCHGPSWNWDLGMRISDLGLITSNPKSEIPHPKSVWVDRPDLNRQSPHSQCGALIVKLRTTGRIWGRIADCGFRFDPDQIRNPKSDIPNRMVL